MWFKKLIEIKKNSGKTTEEISQLSNIPKGTLNKIFSGATKDPQLETIKAILHALGHSLQDLDESTPTNLSLFEEQTLIKKYRTLDEKGKHTVDVVLDIEYTRCTEMTTLRIAGRDGIIEDKTVNKAEIDRLFKELDAMDEEETDF